MPTFKTYYKSPIGIIEIEGTQNGIVAVNFVDQAQSAEDDLPSCIRECAKQIDQYFQVKRKHFALNLLMQGTDFQKSVWRQLKKIPYGRTASYGEVAVAIGKPAACRAVGAANGQNPISIIVPCHRVIGSDGTLTGYGGGLWRKEWLLKHERDNL
jgi:methylated-DNA-[protein]-cysteine S-methyltransferase